MPHARTLATLRAAHARSPKVIQLQTLQENGWPDADTRERLVEPLRQAGVQSTAPFRIAPFDNLCVQLFTHTELCLTAALTTMRGRGTILDLIAEHEDGRALWITNRRPNGLDAPPGREICHAEDVDAKGLLYLRSRHRPRIEWLSFTVDELATHFEERYAKQHAWRDEHGFSLDCGLDALRFFSTNEIAFACRHSRHVHRRQRRGKISANRDRRERDMVVVDAASFVSGGPGRWCVWGRHVPCNRATP